MNSLFFPKFFWVFDISSQLLGNLGIIVLRYNSIPFTKINKSIKIKYTKIVIISQDHRNTKIEQIKTKFNIENEI